MENKSHIVDTCIHLGKAISTLSASSALVQASIFGMANGENEPPTADQMFLELHMLLEPIENDARLLATMIPADTASMDGIDIAAITSKLKAQGTIVDMTAVEDATKLIQTKGFAPFLDKLRDMNSKIDRSIADVEAKFDDWKDLDNNDRIAAIKDPDDDGITPAVAKLGTSVTELHSFATFGMMMLKAVAAEQSTTTKQLETVEA